MSICPPLCTSVCLPVRPFVYLWPNISYYTFGQIMSKAALEMFFLEFFGQIWFSAILIREKPGLRKAANSNCPSKLFH
jgi:hypothetical protein